MEQRFLGVEEVAELTGRAKGTLNNDRALRRGIPFIRLHGQIRYDRDDVLEYLRSRRVSTCDDFSG